MLRQKSWSGMEMGILRKRYSSLGAKGVEFLLPNRSYQAIRTKASRLSLKFLKEKPLVVRGYTIRTLTCGTIFENRICTVFEDMYNECHVSFCSEARYKACCKDEECDMCSPTCEKDVKNFLNLTCSGLERISWKGKQRRIHTKLNRIWKKCKPIEITVSRIEK